MRRKRLAGIFICMALASCAGTDDGRSTVETSPAGTAISLSSRFGPGMGQYRAIAATDRYLVGIGAEDEDRPEVVTPVAEGEIVDLGSGRSSTVPAPVVGGDIVHLTGGGADASQFVGVGRRCQDPACQRGAISSFSLDPATSTWTELEVPDSWTQQTVVGSPYVQVLADGRFMATVTVGSGYLVGRLSGGAWEEVAVLDGPPGRQCATSTDLYDLQVTGGGAELSSVPQQATPELRKVDLDSGTVASVDLPPMSTWFGAAGVALGCDPDGVVLAFGEPATDGSEASSGIVRLHEQVWVPVQAMPEVAGDPAYPGEVVTGPLGVVVGRWRPGPEPSDANVLDYLAIDVSGKARVIVIPNEGRDSSYYWAGTAGEFLMVTTHPTRVELRMIEVWQ